MPKRSQGQTWQELTERVLALINQVSDRLPDDQQEQAAEYAVNAEWELALDHLRGLPLTRAESQEVAALEEELRRLSPGLGNYLRAIAFSILWRVDRGRWLRPPLPMREDDPPSEKH